MLPPAAYAVVTICASRSLRVISGSRYVEALAGGRANPEEPRTRFPHGVRHQAFAASENRIICAALRFITSSSENASQSSFGRIIRHQRSSRRISRSRQLSIMQLSRLSFPFLSCGLPKPFLRRFRRNHNFGKHACFSCRA